jgi:uncharacterized membrane protein
MSSWYFLVKWVHVVSSTVLFGTGAGIAFFFLRAHRTGDVRIMASVGRDVVLADMVFTATAVTLQPVTGIVLALMAGYTLSSPWLLLSILFYGLIGCCWLPVCRGRGFESRVRQESPPKYRVSYKPEPVRFIY